jgi:hypothetical protein
MTAASKHFRLRLLAMMEFALDPRNHQDVAPPGGEEIWEEDVCQLPAAESLRSFGQRIVFWDVVDANECLYGRHNDVTLGS